MKAFSLLAEHVHPLALGSVSRLLDQTKLVAFRLLSTRANPFSEAQNGAAQAAAEQMLKSMPQVGFERVLLNSRWEREV